MLVSRQKPRASGGRADGGSGLCELFAVSSRAPTRLSLSMSRLASRGAPGGKLADGWGVACYDGFDARVLREPEAADSAWLTYVINSGRPHSRIVIAHIRHATQGSIALANTQPFTREPGGRVHVFAHNGMLADVERAIGPSCQRYRPVGATDSEIAFCGLMERMAPLWEASAPSPEARLETLAPYVEDLRGSPKAIAGRRRTVV
jgi:predicted glutamine amidotransferase